MKSKYKVTFLLSTIGILTVLLGVMLFFALGDIYMMSKYSEALKDVKFIAHRGLSSKYYENSEEAFLAAAESDFFYGIETDVYFTADGVPVCVHNDKTFDGSDVSVTDLTSDQIKDLKLKTDLNGFSGEKLCTFEKYLEICSTYNKVAVIELKQWNMNKEQIGMLIDMAKSVCEYDFIMIGFNQNYLKSVKEIDPNINTQHLVSYTEDFINSLNEGFNVSVNVEYIDETILKDTCANTTGIGLWTINDIEEAVKYAEYGVDYITTNHDFLAELREQGIF